MKVSGVWCAISATRIVPGCCAFLRGLLKCVPVWWPKILCTARSCLWHVAGRLGNIPQVHLTEVSGLESLTWLHTSIPINLHSAFILHEVCSGITFLPSRVQTPTKQVLTLNPIRGIIPDPPYIQLLKTLQHWGLVHGIALL